MCTYMRTARPSSAPICGVRACVHCFSMCTFLILSCAHKHAHTTYRCITWLGQCKLPQNVYIHTHGRIKRCVCASMYGCMSVCIYIYINTYIYIYIYRQTGIYIYIYIYYFVYIQTNTFHEANHLHCTHAYMHAYGMYGGRNLWKQCAATDTHTHTNMHTYIHMHTPDANKQTSTLMYVCIRAEIGAPPSLHLF
jgi:hypothetical protein